MGSFSQCRGRCFLWLLLLFISLCPARAAVYQTADEFTSAGDFDGDGQTDVVSVDKASGNFRIGYQLAPGQYTWAKARGSGLENVTGFSVGRLISAGRDALAFAAPDGNRVNILEALTPDSAALPVSAYAPTIGPSLVIALDIGGAGNTALDDLFVGSIGNSGAFPNQLSLLRANAGSFTPIVDGPLTSLPEAGDPVTLKTSGPKMAGLILRGNASDTFRAYNLAAGSLLQAVQLTGLPTNSVYLHANFNASPLAQFLFYQPGGMSAIVRLRPITEPSPGTFDFGAETQFTFDEPIQQMILLQNGATARLLIIFGEGAKAVVYDFDGVNPPVGVQQLDAPAGEVFSGAAALANGGLMMLSGQPGTGRSSHFQSYNFSGGKYLPGAAGNLPTVTALSSSANVFQFETEPFVASAPNLLRTLNAGDWTSHFNGAALPQLSVTVESFVGRSNGLDNPAPLSLGTANPLTHYGLVNQYLPPISLFSTAKGIGDEVADVKITPAAGLYHTAINISFAAKPAGAQIFYRLGAGNWTLFNNSPVPIFKETTVSFYAKAAASQQKSPIHHAAYKFTEGPSTLDSDADGVPDFVELGKGLDPRKGSDSDGDGYSDLDELLQGTNPNDPASTPNGPRVELKSGFDLIQTPRPLDGTQIALTTSQPNTALRAYDLSGELLRYTVTENLNLPVINPAANLTNLFIKTQQRLLAVATEQHFDIQTPSADTKLGRELLGLRAVPNVAYQLDVGYQYSGGDLTTEANAWIAAAQAAQNNVKHETVVGELDMFDTLTALLVEKKISELLVERGLVSATNFTLFPFRPTDSSRDTLTPSTLLSLEAQGTNGQPAYLISAIYGGITNAIRPLSPFNSSLRDTTTEIYRISSASNNAAPGQYPSPVDTLRDFLWTGLLHSNYLAATTLTPAQLAEAYVSAGQLLDNIQQRPTTNLTLQVRPDTFAGNCTLLDTVPAVASKSLFFANGQPYRLLENFELPTGSQIHVFGYTDIPGSGCAGDPIEVIALSLDSVPATSAVDSDGDLLADDWEWLMFGSLAQDGNGDFDGDGISNLQEFFDHTDPRDGKSKAALPVKLGPPELTVEGFAGNQLKLTWSWPDAYANKIKVGLEATDTFGQPFVPAYGAVQNLGGGQFQMILPKPDAGVRFYRLRLTIP